MRILLTGATGFIGRHLSAALLAAGHEVVCLSRSGRPREDGPRGPLRFVAGDFAALREPAAWRPLLEGIDVVINAVGILRESSDQRFDVLHEQAPRALFDACVQARVPRVIQISALGADEGARSAYHLSKRAADEHLLSLPLAATVVQPSLVFGPGGASASLFGTWASAPVQPLPGRGDQPVQPIHVDDAVAAIVALVERPSHVGRRVALVGPEPMGLGQFLARLRSTLGLGRALVMPVPMPLMRGLAWLTGRLPGGLLDPPTLAMLERGNTGDVTDTRTLLGRAPRPVEAFYGPQQAHQAGPAVVLRWLLPLLRYSVAAVWIVTGLLSFGLYPVADSLALLARLGLHGTVALVLLYGAATFDLLLGVAVLAWRRVPLLWAAQIGLILGYTALITWRLPDFWLHPFGPILKNLPMLAAILLLWAFEDSRWNT